MGNNKNRRATGKSREIRRGGEKKKQGTGCFAAEILKYEHNGLAVGRDVEPRRVPVAYAGSNDGQPRFRFETSNAFVYLSAVF